MDSPPIFAGQWISIHAITDQAEEACGRFTAREESDFEISATIVDRSIHIGRPPGGRSERIAGSKQGLFELKITPPGRRGPHTRALYVREGADLLILRVVHKAQRGIPRRDIDLADRDARRWRERSDEGWRKEK